MADSGGQKFPRYEKKVDWQGLSNASQDLSKTIAAKMQESSQKLANDYANLGRQTIYFNTKNLANQQIDEVFQKYSTDPDNLQKMYTQIHDGIIDELLPQERSEFNGWYNAKITGYLSKAKQNAIAQQRDSVKATAIQCFDDSIKQAAWKGADIFSEDEGISYNATASAMMDWRDAFEAAGATDENGTPIFSAVEKQNMFHKATSSFVNQAVRQRFDKLEGLDEKQKFAEQFMNNELNVGILNYEGEEQAVRPSQMMTRAQYEQTINYFTKSIQAGAREMQLKMNEDYVQDVLDEKSTPRQNDKSYQDAVNSVYLQKAEGGYINSPNDIVTFIANTRVMPDAVKETIDSGIQSQNPQSVVQSAKLLSNINNATPWALKGINNDETLRTGLRVANMITQEGFADEDAVKTALNDLRLSKTQSKEQRSALSKAFDETSKDFKWDKKIAEATGAMSGWLWKTPDESRVNVFDHADFKSMARDEFHRNGGDFDSAIEMTSLRFGRKRGYSAASPKKSKIMMYPPEMFYGIGEDNSWMRDAVIEQGSKYLQGYKEKGLIKSFKNDIKQESFDVHLSPKGAEQIQAGERPLYEIMYKDDSNRLWPLGSIDFSEYEVKRSEALAGVTDSNFNVFNTND